jgi:hypothetical protein
MAPHPIAAKPLSALNRMLAYLLRLAQPLFLVSDSAQPTRMHMPAAVALNPVVAEQDAALHTY